MKLNNISKYYYINLDRRKDRYKHIIGEINKSQILKSNIIRYNAVDGIDIDIKNISNKIITPHGISTIIKKKIIHYGITLTFGSAACAISHYNLFKICAEENNGNILILEDDIIIDPDLDNYLQLIDKHEDYDIFYLGYHSSQHTKKIPIDDQNNICYLRGIFWGGFGYILTPKACQYIISNIFPISKQFDSAINEKVRQNKIKTLTFTKKIVKCGQFKSDNQGKDGLKNKNSQNDPWSEVFTKY